MFEKIKAIIVDELGVDAGDVNPSSSLAEDLGADSLDAVELIMAIEEEFDIEIPDEVAGGMKTVQDLISYIEQL